jgi:hypothetical protein
VAGDYECGNKHPSSIKCGELADRLLASQKRTLPHGVSKLGG